LVFGKRQRSAAFFKTVRLRRHSGMAGERVF
jgi:hypothetical protein